LSDERSGVHGERSLIPSPTDRGHAADYAYLSIAADMGFALGGLGARAGLDCRPRAATTRLGFRSELQRSDGDTRFRETLAGRLLVSRAARDRIQY
jgi:hypothetical protein